MTDWIEKARLRLGLEDPDYLPSFGGGETENLAEKNICARAVTDKTGHNPLSAPISHSGDVEFFRKPEETTVSEKRTAKTDETIEPNESPSRSELTKLTKPPWEDRLTILEAAAGARPPDVSDARWEAAMRGLKAFLEARHADAARAAGWPDHELYRVPPVWANISQTGAALLIGDREVVGVTPVEIRIKTASGATTAFYRGSQVDYGVAYRSRLKQIGDDALNEENRLRSLEATVALYRANNPGAGIDAANAAVRAAINSAKETMR